MRDRRTDERAKPLMRPVRTSAQKVHWYKVVRLTNGRSTLNEVGGDNDSYDVARQRTADNICTDCGRLVQSGRRRVPHHNQSKANALLLISILIVS